MVSGRRVGRSVGLLGWGGPTFVAGGGQRVQFAERLGSQVKVLFEGVPQVLPKPDPPLEGLLYSCSSLLTESLTGLAVPGKTGSSAR